LPCRSLRSLRPDVPPPKSLPFGDSLSHGRRSCHCPGCQFPRRGPSCRRRPSSSAVAVVARAVAVRVTSIGHCNRRRDRSHHRSTHRCLPWSSSDAVPAVALTSWPLSEPWPSFAAAPAGPVLVAALAVIVAGCRRCRSHGRDRHRSRGRSCDRPSSNRRRLSPLAVPPAGGPTLVAPTTGRAERRDLLSPRVVRERLGRLLAGRQISSCWSWLTTCSASPVSGASGKCVAL
jgi:hypothetical protein